MVLLNWGGVTEGVTCSMHLPAVLLQVQEEDDIWDPEQLLADVASAIHADREQGRGRTESRSSLVGE